MSKEAIVLKRDAGGRVLVPLPRQVELVREFERSGLSGPKLREVLTRLPTLTNGQIKEVSPEAWAKARLIDNQQKVA